MNNLINSAKRIALMAAGVIALGSLGACGTMAGNLNGLGSNGMSMVVLHKNPDYGPVTDVDYHVTSVHVDSCLKDVHRQQASLLEVMGTNAVLDGSAGYLGGSQGIHAQAAIVGSHLVKHAIPAVGVSTMILTGAQGAVNGMKIKSNAVISIVGPCTNGDLHDPLTAAKVPGLHVYGSSVRTNNSSKTLPSWVKRVSYEPSGPVDTSNPEDH